MLIGSRQGAMTQVDGGAQEGINPRAQLSDKFDANVISIDDLLERELGFRGWGPVSPRVRAHHFVAAAACGACNLIAC